MNPDLILFLQAWTGGGEVTEVERERLLQRLREDAAFRAECAGEMRLLGMVKTVQTPAPRWLALTEALGLGTTESASAAPGDLALRVMQGVRQTGVPRVRRFEWRPLMAAAAGIVFGTFCASVVFGFVAPRGIVKKMPLAIFDPGLESTAPITARDIPSRVGAWGAKSGRVVAAENGVEPREGQRMLRLEPLPRNKQGKTHLSSAYQMLDLHSLRKTIRRGNAEVEVTASFCAANSDVSSRYGIRIFVTNQPPDKARSRFWQRTEDEGVVSVQQTFGTEPGERGWHTFSLKMPLPRGARTLVFILAAGEPTDATGKASAHYLDDVQVSVLTPQPQS